jgi:predicted TIM-barrel fold metal-dependent hydrolase
MAQTPWGELSVSDAHIHFFSSHFYTSLGRQKNLESPDELGALLGWEIPSPNAVELGKRWKAELDHAGVRRACLIASIPGDEASVGAAVQADPDRFFGYFMLSPLEPDALERVKAAAVNPFLHCICLFPAMHAYSVNDPRLIPIWEVASEYALSAFVHCGALSIGVRKKLGLPSPFDIRFSNPLDLHPIATRFPRIRFIVPHFGAGLLRETLMLADLCSNVYLDTSSTNRWMLYESLDLRTVFRRTIDLLGHERLLFGTDSSFFPRGWQPVILDQQATALYELGLDKQKAEQILYRNLERIHEPRMARMQRRTTAVQR